MTLASKARTLAACMVPSSIMRLTAGQRVGAYQVLQAIAGRRPN
jgi:hypothetical protein